MKKISIFVCLKFNISIQTRGGHILEDVDISDFIILKYTKVAGRFYLLIFIINAGNFIIINLKSSLPARFQISKILLCLKN